jgi:hypothetical protein
MMRGSLHPNVSRLHDQSHRRHHAPPPEENIVAATELFASEDHREREEAKWPIGLAVGTLPGVTVFVARW